MDYKLVKWNSFELIKKEKNKSLNMIITSPPYNIWKSYEVRTELFGASLCPECYHTMISIMNYKNYKDIPEEEKVMLQKVLNKIVKNHLTNRNK